MFVRCVYFETTVVTDEKPAKPCKTIEMIVTHDMFSYVKKFDSAEAINYTFSL